MDISKCSNTKCPSREDCFRYRVKPSFYSQSYSEFKFDETGKCKHFSLLEGWSESVLIPRGALVKDQFGDI